MGLRGTLYIISAPSGGGKTSLVNALVNQIPQMKISISHTTRPARPHEEEGVHYFFVDEPSFNTLQEKGQFLESAKVFNYFYGTSKETIERQLEAGFDILLDIDWQGARQIKAQMECVQIFIVPPSREALLERLRNRKQDSETIISERMRQANREIAHFEEYDFLIINDTFELALADLVAIVKSQRLRVSYQKDRFKQMLSTLIQEA